MFQRRITKLLKPWLFAWSLGILWVSAIEADGPPAHPPLNPPESILFVGNSFTFYNNAIYTHLRGLLVAEAPSNRQAIFLKSMTISGAKLADHEGGLNQMLDLRPWDVIVLQGHSREAIDKEMAPGFKATAQQFANRIRSKGAEPVLFMTWAYADKPEMTEPMAMAMEKLGVELNALVVPVGLAFRTALASIPGVALHHRDRIHPSLAGTYLAAAVFYSALYEKSPVALDYDAGLDNNLARQLRQAAWDSVQSFYASNDR